MVRSRQRTHVRARARGEELASVPKSEAPPDAPCASLSRGRPGGRGPEANVLDGEPRY